MFLGTQAMDWISAFVRFLGSTGPKGQLTGGKLPIFQFWKPKKWFFMIFSSKNWLFSYSIAKIWLIKTYENKRSLKKSEKIKKCRTKISEGSLPPICRIRPLWVVAELKLEKSNVRLASFKNRKLFGVNDYRVFFMMEICQETLGYGIKLLPNFNADVYNDSDKTGNLQCKRIQISSHAKFMFENKKNKKQI